MSAAFKLADNDERELARITLAPMARPEIVIRAGQQVEIIAACENVLVENAARLGIFQRGGELVRLIRLDRKTESGGLVREAGTIQLQPVSIPYLQHVLCRLIKWRKMLKSGDTVAIDCPLSLAASYLALAGEWGMPELAGFIEAPIMRSDGSILSAEGYDETTRLYLIGSDWLDVPAKPTKADALTALDELLAPFAQFPFVDAESKTVFAALLLTTIQRRLLPSAPLFVFDAPTQGTGKTKLPTSAGLIALGRDPGAHTVAADAQEIMKAVTSALREGQPMICLDNIVRVLDSDALAVALTTLIYKARMLGKSEMLALLTNCTITGTGNNILLGGDLPRRSLKARLDSKLEFPNSRTFDIPDLEAYLLENRKSLIRAALTVIKAYRISNERLTLAPFGSFEQWSREIREPLVWLGMADPVVTSNALAQEDPDRELNGDTLAAWYAAFTDKAIKVTDVVPAAMMNEALSKQLLLVASSFKGAGMLDSRRLGNWCRSVRDKICGDYVMRCVSETGNAKVWRVEKLTADTSGDISTPTPKKKRRFAK